MLVKFISEKSVEPYRGLVEADGVVYTNDEEKAIAAGFRPLVIDEIPAEKENCHQYLTYEETADCIYGRWKETEIGEEVI